jgi:hypothetical protein
MSQNAAILSHLLSGKSITPIEALNKYGCFRLGARVHDLKSEGHKIDKETVHDRVSGKRFARYSMDLSQCADAQPAASG